MVRVHHKCTRKTSDEHKSGAKVHAGASDGWERRVVLPCLGDAPSHPPLPGGDTRPLCVWLRRRPRPAHPSGQVLRLLC